MSLTRTKRDNPCPVCEDTTGNCRQSKTDADYWQCMSYADAKKGDIIGQFKCIGHTRDRLWSQFKLDNTQEWCDERRREWQVENQRRQQEKAKMNVLRRQRSLSVEQRHEQYTRMLSELTLHPDDRADLLRRGFTPDEIELCGFKSIGRYQQLESQFNGLLPGVSRGNRLIIRNEGYLCPVRDVDGLIVACQLRLRILPTAESGRYRWLSGDGQVLHLFPEGCQPEGELPLAVHFPQQRQKCGVGIGEGTGAKPFLAAQRLGIPFIGAAGGLFTSSPRLLQIYLEKLNFEREQEIIIPVDAGDAINNQVLARWHRVSAFIEKLGYSVKFAWWGQTTKDQPDIDELDNLDSIQYLTPTQFAETVNAARKEFGFEARINLNLSEKEQVTPQKNGFTSQENGFAPKPENNVFDDSEPDPAEYAAYVEQEQEQLKVEEVEAKARQQQFKDSYPERAKAAWRKTRRFTSDILKATQWFEADLPPENSIFFGRAGLGRGKSTQLAKWVKLWKQQNKGFICLGYRNTLLLQLCSEERLGFYHLHESDAAVMQRDPSSGIALCVDSLWRFKPEDFEGKIIIIDEVMSVVRHLLHSPTVKGRDNILRLFHQALQRASQVICLDGNLTDWAVKYLHELAPDKKIIRLDNTYRSDKALVNFLLGAVSIEEEVKKNDRSPWLHHLLNDSQTPAVCSDSQVFAESLDNLLTEMGLEVLRVDSKTVPEEHVKEFLKSCDAYIEKHQVDVLIYTPSAESGVDVSIKDYFTHHFAFFFGVLGVDAILQMLGRIRDSQCTKFVWVREWVAQSEQTHSRSPFTKAVGKAIEQMLIQDITDTISGVDRDQEIIVKLWGIIQQSKDPHFEASNQIQAIANYEKGNLRECVLEALKDSGYKIRLCTLRASEETRDSVKKATEKTKRLNCHDIFTTEKIAIEFADELKKFDAKWEDRVKVIQATYRSRLLGIDETESWTENFIYKIRYDNPDFISQQELFWLFSHPEVANRMNQERYHRIAQKECTFIGNIRSRMARIRALCAIGFEKFLDTEKTWEEDTPELLELVSRCKDEKIAAALGRHPGQQANIRFFGSLLKMLGLKLKGKKIKSDDGDYRIYQLDRNALYDIDRRNALQCLDRRWENYLTKEVEILNWDEVINSQEAEAVDNQACQQAGGHSQQTKQPQARTAQAFDPVPRTPPEYIYIKEGFVEPNKSQSAADELAKVAVAPVDLVDELLVAFAFCESDADFVAAIDAYPAQVVTKAIALADPAPKRQQLREWYNASVAMPAAVQDLETFFAGEVVSSASEELKASLASVETWGQFRAATAGYLPGEIQSAIDGQEDEAVRCRLLTWYEPEDAEPAPKHHRSSHRVRELCNRVVGERREALAIQSAQPVRQTLSWSPSAEVEASVRQAVSQEALATQEIPSEPTELPSTPKAFVVGQRLKGLRDGFFAGKVAKVTEAFGDWCQTTLGYVTMDEIDGGCWAFV